VDMIAAMPLLVKLHLVNAYLTIGYFPFTRLVHVLVVPNPYLWRKAQVVRWSGRTQRNEL
jgi:nitrate reductase gamma subunit